MNPSRAQARRGTARSVRAGGGRVVVTDGKPAGQFGVSIGQRARRSSWFLASLDSRCYILPR